MREFRRPVFPMSVVSSLVGVAPSTIRRWEAAGIVAPIRRRNGWRMFSWEDIDTLQRAKHLVRRGRTLQQVRREVRRPVKPAPVLLATPMEVGRRLQVLGLPVIVRAR